MRRKKSLCEHRKNTDKAHLILRTLDEFDITYLHALLKNDSKVIDEREELARASNPYWHRDSGKLARGVLQRTVGNCTAKFDIYTPDDLSDCPFVVVICRNPHTHPPPHPLMLDSGFISGLRRSLGWTKPFDPPLAALHPSLGNLDHIRCCIDGLRKVLFPDGTGFEGAQLLAAEHCGLPEGEQYVRCAEKHTLVDGKTFYLVICMLRSMSALLMRSKKLSLDTAFKCLNGKWQEFEMETWEVDHMKSIIGTRAFTTSQSAEAHLILFTRIFEIAHADTGIPCRFRHIHGEGFEIWITDAHKGQALGVGMYCQKLCAHLGDVYCPMEPARLLRTLDPCDHLRRFLRLCTTHYKRNIRELRPYTTQQVRAAMLSLSSSQVHPDLELAFRIIENGGRKAKVNLRYLHSINLSLIPLEIWKSAPSTSNGNEQSHRNVNRDGVNLTMLSGIMRGMQYDARAMGALELHASQAPPTAPVQDSRSTVRVAPARTRWCRRCAQRDRDASGTPGQTRMSSVSTLPPAHSAAPKSASALTSVCSLSLSPWGPPPGTHAVFCKHAS
ncbi:hypothetical protein B0H14DRAFT_3092562 [Mycena olivaceomarginata]|nr:hypothetical protein B0H14DRAFT_3092562 [Mycena olivaceomarginata]